MTARWYADGAYVYDRADDSLVCMAKTPEAAAHIASLPGALRVAVSESDMLRAMGAKLADNADTAARMATEANVREAEAERKIRTLRLALRVVSALLLLSLALGGAYVLAH